MDEKLLKILLIGDKRVGKTAFAHRYTTGAYSENYKATIGVEFSLKIIKLSDSESVRVQLWDIQGQDNVKNSLTRVYYRDASACMIFYDVTNLQSYTNVVRWKKDLDEKVCLPSGKILPCLLVGNKCDLPDRCVSDEEAEMFAEEHDFIASKRVSAKTSFNVSESMDCLVKEVLRRYEEIDPEHDPDTNVRHLGDSYDRNRGGCGC